MSTVIERVFTSFKDFRKTREIDKVSYSEIPFLRVKEVELDIANSAFFPYILYTLWDNGSDIIGAINCRCIQNYRFIYDNTSNNKDPYTRFISYIVINPKYQNQGYSLRLIKGFFEFLNRVEITDEISMSAYTKLGYKYLRNNLLKLTLEYKIKLKDTYCFED